MRARLAGFLDAPPAGTVLRNGDFEFSVDWKISSGGNSGIIYRTVEDKFDFPWQTGPEMQILDDAKHADGKSILTCIAIRNICKGDKQPNVAAECRNPNNRHHLKKAGADEIISSDELGLRLLARTALFHGMTRVYQELLTVGRDANEMFLLPAPEELIGKDFVELLALFGRHRSDRPAAAARARTRSPSSARIRRSRSPRCPARPTRCRTSSPRTVRCARRDSRWSSTATAFRLLE